MVLELDSENKGISIQTEFPCYSIQFQDESNLKKTFEEITSKHSQIRGCIHLQNHDSCLLYTSPSPRDATLSRMPSSA